MLLRSLLLILALTQVQSLTPQGVDVSWLLEKRTLYRCVPWTVMKSGTYEERLDPLVCNPTPGDGFETDFLWNWI